MSLHDELVQVVKANNVCRTCAWLDTLSPEDRATWVTELAYPVSVIGHKTIVDYLLKHFNVKIAPEALGKHRRNHGTA